MTNKYGIVRVDRVHGVADGRLKAKDELQNGLFVVQDEVTGELKLPTAITEKTVLVASVCNQYDSMNEGDFTNVVGGINPRTLDLIGSDIVTITKFATSGTSAKTSYATIAVGDVGTVSAATGELMFTTVANIPATAVAQYEVIGKTKLNGDEALQIKKIV